MKNSHALAATIAAFAAGAAAIQALHAQTKAPGYLIVEADISNPDGFLKEYVPLVGKATEAAGGKYVARGGKVAGIEGEPPKPRTVIIEFDSLEQAQAAVTKPAYIEARAAGNKYAKFRIWAIEGIPR